jgi:hypothetical protein
MPALKLTSYAVTRTAMKVYSGTNLTNRRVMFLQNFQHATYQCTVHLELSRPTPEGSQRPKPTFADCGNLMAGAGHVDQHNDWKTVALPILSYQLPRQSNTMTEGAEERDACKRARNIYPPLKMRNTLISISIVLFLVSLVGGLWSRSGL